MSGFLRPEVRALLWRWREALVALAVAGFGLWIALSPGPVVAGLGWLIAAAGLVIFGLALRRIRFAGSGDGPGVVTLDEGRLSYLGPYYGGAVSLKELMALSLRRAKDGKAYWVLAQPDQVLVVPVNARGGDVLFDAFTALDGLSMPHLLRQLDDTTPGTITLWRREARVALT